MPSFEDLTSDTSHTGCEPLEEYEPERLKWPGNAAGYAKGIIEAEEVAYQKAAWRLRIAKREIREFRLSRAGELAMSATVLSLGICAALQSVHEGRLECIPTCVMGIIWSLGVGREVLRDFKSPDYGTLVNNVCLESISLDVALTPPEVGTDYSGLP